MALLLAGLLSGCVVSPRTVSASAGHEAAPVLFVSSVSRGLITAQSNITYAQDMATALEAYGVPATVKMPQGQSWQLQVSVKPADQNIFPSYRIIGPDQKMYGQLAGKAVSAQGWNGTDQTALSQMAGRDAAILSDMLAKINAKVQLTNPSSLANRPPRLFIGAVSGVPDGSDLLLSADLRRDLSTSGLKLVTAQNEADFTITANIKIVPVAVSDTAAEVNWLVHDSNGRLVGQVTQLRELGATAPSTVLQGMTSSLAQEAASGVVTVVHNDIVKGHGPASH